LNLRVDGEKHIYGMIHIHNGLKISLLLYKIAHSHTNGPKYLQRELTHIRCIQRELIYAHTEYQRELMHVESQLKLTQFIWQKSDTIQIRLKCTFGPLNFTHFANTWSPLILTQSKLTWRFFSETSWHISRWRVKKKLTWLFLCNKSISLLSYLLLHKYPKTSIALLQPHPNLHCYSFFFSINNLCFQFWNNSLSLFNNEWNQWIKYYEFLYGNVIIRAPVTF